MGTQVGFVEHFDGETISGRILASATERRPLAVDIYVGGTLAATAEAEGASEPAGDEGPSARFTYRFAMPFCAPGGPLELPTIPDLVVCAAGTTRRLGIHHDLQGVVNVDPFSISESFLLLGDNGFMPVPSPKLRAHVAGAGSSERNYREVGLFVALDLMFFGLLWPGRRVLDLGCGCGRVGAYIAPVVGDKGKYWGFDTWGAGIEWATEMISPAYPQATFRSLSQAAAARREKDSTGYVGEKAYELPVKAGEVDTVLCASLFTHLTFEASLDYLVELRRVLQPGGRVYLSCFVLDDETRGNLKGVRLREEEYGAYFDHPTFFDTFFYDRTWKALFAKAGFRPAIFRYGHWRGAQYQQRRPIGYQDLFILQPVG